jgi:calcineurin-like phosphoesterase family protein
MSTVYFASDLHFGHKNIINYRPDFKFDHHSQHDDFVTARFLETLGKRDTLWVLGDTCFDMESFDKIKAIFSSVKQVNKIIGNHDFERKECPTIQDYLALGNVKLHAMVSYKGHWITHAPIHPDELRGKKNIHGHTHNHCIDDERYINVSLEQINYKPAPFSSL